MGHLPQRNSVYRVRILILFVYLAKRENPKVRMSEDKKANVTDVGEHTDDLQSATHSLL